MQHSSSQPSPTSYRRIYSPLTIDTSSHSNLDPSPRRYSASAAVSPPGHHHSLSIPPIFNLVPPSPHQSITRETINRLTNQWHIPVILHACKKSQLASTLLYSNEQLPKHMSTDGFVDCTKDDLKPASGSTKATATIIPTVKPRKRGKEELVEMRSYLIIFR